ncbi:unnamed protein product [Leptosia nina]|uniref:Uncharacterized protein n=1 Tax=Leptosia nina TaxID=320188 RepID=A0AAV1K038_9NEOP
MGQSEEIKLRTIKGAGIGCYHESRGFVWGVVGCRGGGGWAVGGSDRDGRRLHSRARHRREATSAPGTTLLRNQMPNAIDIC